MGNHRRPVGVDESFYTQTTDGGRSPVDRICDALSNETCRFVMYALNENEPTELEDVIDEVVEKQTGLSPAEVDDETHSILRTRLHHQHLPKLSDLGIVEYDPRSEAIRYREPPPHLDEFLHLTKQLDMDYTD